MSDISFPNKCKVKLVSVNLWLDVGVCCVQWTVYTYGKKGNEKVHEKKYLER